MNDDTVKKSSKKNIPLLITDILFYIFAIAIIAIGVYLLIPKKAEVYDKTVLLENNIILTQGEKHQLQINSDREVFYKTENPKIAVVDSTGMVFAVNVGETIITVQAKNGKEEYCNVIVDIISIDNITLNEQDIKMNVGNTALLKATIAPENATNKTITWESSDPSIVTVTEGYLEAKKSGSVIITASTVNGKSAACNVIVEEKKKEENNNNNKNNNNGNNNNNDPKIEVTGIKLNYDTMTMIKAENGQLEAIIIPENATNKKITWSTSDSKIVAVSKTGQIHANNTGTATITAKASNGITATVKITVKNKTYNKTAIFIGDSITLGGGYSWANYIGDNYDLKSTVNAGLSGGFISDNRPGHWLVDVVKQHSSEKYDYVILHGGINDISCIDDFGISMGSYNKDDFSGNYDTKTFIGGFEYYLYTAKQQWPNAKIGYIINYKTPFASDVVKHDKEYYSKMAEVLKKWGIHYINLYSGKTASGEKYSDLLQVNTKNYLSDGVHLTKAGYELVSPHIYEWMKTL